VSQLATTAVENELCACRAKFEEPIVAGKEPETRQGTLPMFVMPTAATKRVTFEEGKGYVG
jgi:hypothetical protein